jgi:hypothetical protein
LNHYILSFVCQEKLVGQILSLFQSYCLILPQYFAFKNQILKGNVQHQDDERQQERDRTMDSTLMATNAADKRVEYYGGKLKWFRDTRPVQKVKYFIKSNFYNYFSPFQLSTVFAVRMKLMSRHSIVYQMRCIQLMLELRIYCGVSFLA